MYALLTAIVFAQSSVTIGVGDKPKKDSASIIERDRQQDSSRYRYEVWRDSMIAAHANTNNDSADQREEGRSRLR